MIEKRVAEEDIFIEKRLLRNLEPCFKGQYLHITRSHGPRLQFEIETRPNDDDVVFPPCELFEPFLHVGEGLTMFRSMYKALLERTQMHR